jgi:hypothetical protein
MSSTSAESERTAQSARRHESHRPPSAARPYVSPLREAASTKAVHAESSPVLAILAARGISPRHIGAAAAGAKAGRQRRRLPDWPRLPHCRHAVSMRGAASRRAVLSRKLPLRDHIDPHTAARQGFAPLVPQHARGARAVVASRSRTRTADQPRARHSESADAFRHHPAPLSARCSGPFLLWLFLDALFGPLLAPQSTSEIIDSTIWCFNAAFGAIALFGSIAVAMKRQNFSPLAVGLVMAALSVAGHDRRLVRGGRASAQSVRLAKTQHGLAKSSRGRPATL